jgi:hypothetical protein
MEHPKVDTKMINNTIETLVWCPSDLSLYCHFLLLPLILRFQSLYHTTITWPEEMKRKKIPTTKMIWMIVNDIGIILR